MTKSGNLWAIGYDDMERANQVRDEIVRLGWDKHYLLLDDVAVVVRHPDGSFTFDRKAFPAVSNVLGCSVVGFLAGLVVGAPLVGATIGAMVGGTGSGRRLGLGWNRRRLCQGSEGADEARDVRHFRPGLRGGYGCDIAQDTRPGRNGVEDQRGSGACTANPIQSTLAAPSTQPGKSDAK
jgi:hypothetical protein